MARSQQDVAPEHHPLYHTSLDRPRWSGEMREEPWIAYYWQYLTPRYRSANIPILLHPPPSGHPPAKPLN
ncbi:hypothetical protein J6590_007810 [Homalodisca vitripennis]|nr:hypothetical protein J6590_007810 [Homalodisca vitripennis]